MGKYFKNSPTPVRVSKGLLAVILAAAMGLAVLCMWYFSTLTSHLDPDAQIGTLSVSQRGESRAAGNTISIILNTSPYFETGTAPGNIFFENPSSSGKLERLELYRDDTGELIYKSGYLKPGSYIDYAPLDVALAAGDYACTAVIYGYTEDTQEYIGRVAAGIIVYVLH